MKRNDHQKPSYFSTLSDEKKEKLFFETVAYMSEVFGLEIYDFLRELEIPDEEIAAQGILPEAGLLACGAKIEHLKNSEIRLGKLLEYYLADDLYLVHLQGDCHVPLDHLNKLTRGERKRFSDLLDAHVCSSRSGVVGMEIVIDGIAPERLESLQTVLEAHERKTQQRQQTM